MTNSSSVATKTSDGDKVLLRRLCLFPYPRPHMLQHLSAQLGQVKQYYLQTWDSMAILPTYLMLDDGQLTKTRLRPDGFALVCLDCSVVGSVEIFNGSYSTTFDPTDPLEGALDFVKEGYVELQVNGFAAHMELEALVQPNETLTSYTSSFPVINGPSFYVSIPTQIGNDELTRNTGTLYCDHEDLLEPTSIHGSYAAQ